MRDRGLGMVEEDDSEFQATSGIKLYSNIPVIIKLILEMSVITLVLLGGPRFWKLISKGAVAWYSPFDMPPPNDRAQMLVGPEVERWSTLAYVLCSGLILSNRLSELLSRIITFIFRKYRQSLQKETIKFLELSLSCSRYMFYLFTAMACWAAVRELFPLPLDPRIAAYKAAKLAGKKDVKMPTFLERPKYYHLSSLAFAGVFYTAFLALEQCLLYSLNLYFGKTVYRERVAQCNYRLWVVKTLRSAYVRGSNRKSTAPASDTPNLASATYGERRDNVAEFLLENAGAGQASREGMADLLFDYYSRPPDGFELVQHTPTDIMLIDQLSGVFSKSDLKRSFAVFDPTESGVTSREEFKRAVNEVYAERTAILNGISGHGKMVAQLDSLFKRLIMALTLIFVFFAYGIRMDNLTKILTFLMIPASRALKAFFSAITYIFTTHPFDIGDRVTVSGTHFFVQNVGLLFTQFRRMDGAVVYYPNYLLANLAVNNIKRTPKQSQKFELVFDGDSTSTQKIGLLRQRIQEALTSKASREFTSGQTWFLQMPEASKIVLTLILNHNTNQQEGHPWAMRNTHFLDLVREITQDLGLQYRPPVRSLLCEDEISAICIDTN